MSKQKTETQQLQASHAQELVEQSLKQQQLQDMCSHLRADLSNQASIIER